MSKDFTGPAEIVRTVTHRGCELAFVVRGEGPPVVFIQGVAVHGGGWRPQVEALSQRHACLTFDNRGMGRSQPRGDAKVSVEAMAEDTLRIMDAQGWASAHLVGHSLGGVVALHVALTARERVRSLALLCTFARGRDATRLSWPMLSAGSARGSVRDACGGSLSWKS